VRGILLAAIRERRMLILTYVRAIEPQLFAPTILWLSTTNELMIRGYEFKASRVRPREIEVAGVGDIRQTLLTFSLSEDVTPTVRLHPSGRLLPDCST
jgi:hypothetical protein